VCSEKYYPFKNFSLAKYSNIKTDKRAISKTDIEKIKKVKLRKPNLLLAKHLFLFSFYCRGMNFVDMAFLKWKDIKNKRLTYTRKKTREHFNIGLLKPALDILRHHKTVTFKNKESYVFPIFNENHISPQTVYNRKVKMLRQVNKDLKTIAKQAKIQTELTTYVARHSYATILKLSGVSTSIISEALGHASEKITQVYLTEFGDDILDKASKAIL
jgi:integrase